MKITFSKKISDGNNKKRNVFLVPLIAALLIAVYIFVSLSQPFQTTKATQENIKIKLPKIAAISWPDYGQASIGSKDYGLLGTNGQQTSHPIASIAKTILSLALVEQKPLSPGQTGPTITMTQQDVDFYHTYLAQNGSLVPVNFGEKMNEYQMLQALLLPSGDNIADTLAVWGFGSVNSYLDYANKMVGKWGLKQTHVADASGLSPQTVSSAKDLVTIAEKVMDNPVLAEIVGQSTATLPVAGAVKNYDTILGQDGVVGIKTGNTEEAGGCFMFAANSVVDGKTVTLIGAILGATTRGQALNDTKKLLESNSNGWQFVDAIKARQTVGSYHLAWGKTVNVTAKNDVSVLAARDSQIKINASLQDIKKPMAKGTKVGTITVRSGDKTTTTPAILETDIPGPNILWKLTHP